MEIEYQGLIKGFPLLKFQKKEIIDKIIQGSFYMNSLKVYREWFQNSGDEEIGDPFEGELYVNNAQLIIPEKNIVEQCNKQFFRTSHEDDFVFCMFGINSNYQKTFSFTEEQKKKWLDIYDTALIIKDQPEFFNRIKNKSKELKINMVGNFVNYYDDSVDNADLLIGALKGTKNCVFQKRKKYSYQQEYRFTFENTTKAKSFEINIGDISDISIVFPLEKILSSKFFKH